jgi:hypothetical protein
VQTATQLRVAFFHMISDFTTFKCCCRRIADPPPSYRLPPLQLVYFTTQLIRFRHGSGQLLKSRPEFNADSHETPSGCRARPTLPIPAPLLGSALRLNAHLSSERRYALDRQHRRREHHSNNRSNGADLNVPARQRSSGKRAPQKAAARSLAPCSMLSMSILASVAASNVAAVLLRITTGFRS